MLKHTILLATLTLIATSLSSFAQEYAYVPYPSGKYSGEAKVSASVRKLKDEPCTVNLELADKGNRVYIKNINVECPKVRIKESSPAETIYAGDVDTKQFGIYDKITSKINQVVSGEKASISKFERIDNKIELEMDANLPINDDGKDIKIKAAAKISEVSPGTLEIEAQAKTGILIVGKLTATVKKISE